MAPYSMLVAPERGQVDALRWQCLTASGLQHQVPIAIESHGSLPTNKLCDGLTDQFLPPAVVQTTFGVFLQK